jgi:hypothetical protein
MKENLRSNPDKSKQGQADNDACEKIVQSADFYMENNFVVFTEAYHIKRGYCCRSGCRHCPYGFKQKG